MFLELDNLHAGYGRVEVLHGVTLHVDEGEIVSILGANGAGKTTTLLTVSGLATYMSGSIRLRGEAIHSLRAGTVSGGASCIRRTDRAGKSSPRGLYHP